MSIQIIPQDVSFGQQVGQGFGKTLADQLPQEINRYRLASALKGMQGKNLQPLEQAAELVRAGGEEAVKYLPLIQKSQGKRALEAEAKGGQVSPKTAQEEQAGAQPTETFARTEQQPYASEKEISTFRKKLIQEPTSREIAQMAMSDYSYEPDPDKARELARARIQQDRIAQQSRMVKTETELEKRFAPRFAQGTPLGEASGIKNKLKDMAIVESAKVGSEEAGAIFDKELLNLEKSATNVGTLGAFGSVGTSLESKKFTLNREKKKFERVGLGEEYDELAAGKIGVSPGLVASLTSPLKNDDVLSTIKKITPSRGKYFNKDIDEKDLVKIADSIQNTDNIQSIFYELQKRKLNADQLRNLLGEDKYTKKLTNRQLNQLDKPLAAIYPLSDLFFTLRK